MSRASEGGLAQRNRWRLIGLSLWQTIRVRIEIAMSVSRPIDDPASTAR
jgi:hypothetical protein